jgi:putative transposase
MEMPLPRYKQVNLEVTPYYHCTSRCVRQSFLCGVDAITGKNYNHRRQWIVDRLHRLTKTFAIDLCAYAVMHNHTHVVVHIAKARAEHWSMDEVLLRWKCFYRCPSLVQRYLDEESRGSLSEVELQKVEELSEIYRHRLYSVSWFMRLLNEFIARKANKEDECTGYFWERRFKSQAILSENALAVTMAYTDLNPIRAGIAKTPEQSNFTSIQYRINALKVNKVPARLMPFNDQVSVNESSLPFKLSDYLVLVDETGRIMRPDKKGAIPQKIKPILDRLKLSGSSWITLSTKLERKFTGPIGSAERICVFASACEYGRKPNIANARRYLQ